MEDPKTKPSSVPSSPSKPWPEHVGHREQRKLRARQEGRPHVWFGLGMFGLIGWSIALPTVLGALLGVWIDHRWPSRFSWTLTLIFLGLLWGCNQAWYWITKESHQQQTQKPPNEDN
ncbi:MAG: AtpZ/AtpI family protein [Myxococcales bacterium]|nr:AtpZ/AtpI family protein [Myxococcales bacterium]MCB9641574.1 AtpZ/AtpI family protein [Myxococcales bacterium]